MINLQYISMSITLLIYVNLSLTFIEGLECASARGRKHFVTVL